MDALDEGRLGRFIGGRMDALEAGRRVDALERGRVMGVLSFGSNGYIFSYNRSEGFLQQCRIESQLGERRD